MKSARRLAKRIWFSGLSIFTLSDYLKFRRLDKGEKRFRISPREFYPCIHDKTATTTFERHYVFHTAWAGRCVAEINPKLHVDVGSSVYFNSIVSAFIPIDFYDYRPADLSGLSNLKSLKGDLHHLPFDDSSVKSISCLHTLEHVGLGRYGDPIDPEGDLKAISELKRVVARGGSLLAVVPTGTESRIEFNAHRIYSYQEFVSCFDGFELVEFAYIPERTGGIIRKAGPEMIRDKHGCGCYWFKKTK